MSGKRPAKHRPLNERQQRFVEFYLADPNGTHAARRAGYRGSDVTLATTAHGLLRNHKVAEAIAKQRKPDSDKRLAEAEEIRQFWCAMMRDKQVEPKDRLKASELLGKTRGMFIEKKSIDGKLDVIVRRGNDAAGALAPKEDEE